MESKALRVRKSSCLAALICKSKPGLQQGCRWGMPAASIAQGLSCGNATTGNPRFYITSSLSTSKTILNWYDQAWECESCFRRERQLNEQALLPRAQAPLDVFSAAICAGESLRVFNIGQLGIASHRWEKFRYRQGNEGR
jgi:hypothetical protein